MSENKLEAEQLQTDGMGKDWCNFWGYSKSKQVDVPQQIILQPNIVPESIHDNSNQSNTPPNSKDNK